MIELTLAKSEDGIKINKYLKKVLPSIPDSLLYKLFRKKYFKINDKVSKGTETIHVGDKIKLFLSDDTYKKYRKCEKAVVKESKSNKSFDKNQIIYEDDNVIIFNKPVGLLSQGDTKDSISANSILCDYIKKEKNELFAGSIVNRLDRNTEGIIIFAKTYIASREISKMIKEGNLEKHYKTLVNGVVKKDEEMLTHLFKKDEKNNKAIIKETKSKIDGYTEVKLIYKVIKRYKESTLLDINLLSGKSHQIRAQLAYIGYPIICDKKYMDSETYKKNVEKYKKVSQELTCYMIKFGKFDNEILDNISNKKFVI